jgi:hypothetical protein
MQTSLDKVSDPDHIYTSDQYLDEIHKVQLGVGKGTTTIKGYQNIDHSQDGQTTGIKPKNNGVDADTESCSMIFQNTGGELIYVNSDQNDSSGGLIIDPDENYVRQPNQNADNDELYLHFPNSAGTVTIVFIA